VTRGAEDVREAVTRGAEDVRGAVTRGAEDVRGAVTRGAEEVRGYAAGTTGTPGSFGDRSTPGGTDYGRS